MLPNTIWEPVKGLSKTKGIKNANDPYLQRLKDTNGNRAKIAEIEKEILELKQRGKINPQRWKKLKAWIKLAKDGRLFSIWDMIGVLLEYEVKKTFNCGMEQTFDECLKHPNYEGLVY